MKIAIATSTFYRSYDVRAMLAVETARIAQRMNIPCIVVDGGSPADVVRDIRRQDAVVRSEADLSMNDCRRLAIRLAADIAGVDGAAVWLEPEKHTLLEHLPHAAEVMAADRVDLLVPGRADLLSYPAMQRHAEEFGNACFLELTGLNLDVWFGPKLIGAKALPFYLDYAGDYGDKWEALVVPAIRAIAAGLKVAGHTVPYVHPASQTAAENTPEMMLKRVDQLRNMLGAIIADAKRFGLVRA